MLHKQFEVEHQNAENVANTVEMAASSSKLLQIAWKMDRTGNPNKILTWRQIQKKKRTLSKHGAGYQRFSCSIG